MRLNHTTRIVMGSIAGAIALVLVTGICLLWAWTNSYWWDRDHWNQDKIVQAYISYYTHAGKFPKGMEDLIDAGYLPEKADWYKEPPGLFPRPIDFRNGSYVVKPPNVDDVNNCDMIGRKVRKGGRDETEFDVVSNAELRDAINRFVRFHQSIKDINSNLK